MPALAQDDLFAGPVNRALVRALVYLLMRVRSREIVGFCVEWSGPAGDAHWLAVGMLKAQAPAWACASAQEFASPPRKKSRA